MVDLVAQEDKLNIGCDLDGCVFDFLNPFLEHVKDYGVDVEYDEKVEYRWHEDYDKVIYKAFSEFGSKWEYLPVKEYAPEILNKFKSDGHNIFFITSREKSLRPITERALERAYLSNIPLIHTHDKAFFAKIKNLDLHIEDHPVKSLNVADVVDLVILFDAPYNRKVDHANVERVSNWLEVRNVLDKYGKTRRASNTRTNS